MLAGAMILAAAPCHAETAVETPSLSGFNEAATAAAAVSTSGYIEGGIGHAHLSDGNSTWNDQYLRGHAQVNDTNGFDGEVSHQSHFGDRGTYVGLGYGHVFDDRWHGSINAGTSDGGFFLPRLRLDAFLYHKWLERKSLVTNIGLGYNRAKDDHFDRSLSFGAAWYFDAPWIAEGGVRLNQSNPGQVTANRVFAALTWGRDRHHYLTLRHETGREAYQLIGPVAVLSDFDSRETSVVWRQWIATNVGFNLRVAHYANPSYRRSGLEAGLFLNF